MLRYKRKTRIFLSQTLIQDDTIILVDAHFNYLVNVLRCSVGDIIGVFNNINGEFRAEITNITKKSLNIKILDNIRFSISTQYNLHLCYVPLKKDASDFLIEKAVELGINSISQTISSRCVNNPQDFEKIQAKLISATQQCERLDVPTINPTLKLRDFITQHKDKSHIFWLNEFFLGTTFSKYLSTNTLIHKEIIFLIGPEGGFDLEEKDFLSKNTTAVYFNSNILRAETAGISALLNFNIINCNF